ncbi:MAG: restriction endonuclease [Deinococcus sp.]
MYVNMADTVESILSDKNTLTKGRRLENFIAELFSTIVGLEVLARDIKNDKLSQEIDISIWNDRSQDGFPFLEHIILVECKNWENKATASDIAWFDRKIKDGHKAFGIFVSAHGITGSKRNNTAAYDVLLSSYREGRTIVVLTLFEIKSLTSSRDLISIIKRKLCEMSLGRVEVKAY